MELAGELGLGSLSNDWKKCKKIQILKIYEGRVKECILLMEIKKRHYREKSSNKNGDSIVSHNFASIP